MCSSETEGGIELCIIYFTYIQYLHVVHAKTVNCVCHYMTEIMELHANIFSIYYPVYYLFFRPYHNKYKVRYSIIISKAHLCVCVVYKCSLYIGMLVL